MPSWKKIIVSGSDAELSSVNVGTGTYNTGLFDTYTPATTVGTVVGDFNNILKALAPAQAPAYSTLGATGSVGQASSVSPTFVGVGGLTYISKPYLSGSGIIANNTTFQKYSDTSNRNYLGAISASRAFSGFRITTNPATTANASTYTNYPNGAFFAQLGTTEETWTLKLNGSQLDSFTVRDANASSSINANFGTFTVGPYKSAQFITTGDNVTNYGSRSGSFTFTIPATEANLAWNPGLNNFEVTRSVGGTEYKSNTYWIWDPGVNVSIGSTSNTLSVASSTTAFYGGLDYLTGTAPTIQVQGTVSNFYKYNWAAASNAVTVQVGSLTAQNIAAASNPTSNDTITVNNTFSLTTGNRYLPTNTYSSTITASPTLRAQTSATVTAPANVVLYDNSSTLTNALITNRVKANVGTSGGTNAISNGQVNSAVIFQDNYTIADASTMASNKEGIYYNGRIYGAANTDLDTLWTRITAGTISPVNTAISSQIATWEGNSTFEYGMYTRRTDSGPTSNVAITLTTVGMSGTTVTIKLYYRSAGAGNTLLDTYTQQLGSTGFTRTFTLTTPRVINSNDDVVAVITGLPNSTGYITAMTVTV
jgi:hypothetical protein